MSNENGKEQNGASRRERVGLDRLTAPPKKQEKPLPQPPIDVGRRRLIGAIGAGIVWAAAVKSSATNYQGIMRRYPRNNKAMRPPGALPEKQFLSACTRCAECMKVCPTNALQPALLETGWEGIWTPLLVPSIGPCAEKCTSCGDVCPTHAIRPFTWQDKRYKIKMGLANVNHNTCVAWNGGRDCIVCAEVCPYSAVIFRDVFDDGLPKDPNQPITAAGNKGRMKRVPTVDEKLCTGCGICEYHCPVLPDHSIVVYTFQEDREYNAPKERPTDGFYRGDWVDRKDRGKDAEYAGAVKQIEDMKKAQGETIGGMLNARAAEDWRSWPNTIRALLLDWGLQEGDDGGQNSLSASGELAEAIMTLMAPVGYAWAHFPVCPGGSVLSIAFAADCMEALAQVSAAGGGNYLGRAAHVAHVLAASQSPEGCWPQWCDPQSGAALDESNCAAEPMLLFCRLNQLLDSTEFDNPIERARSWLLNSYSDSE